MSDVSFTMSVTGGSNPLPITGPQIRNAAQLLMIEVRKQFRTLAEKLVGDLRRLYQAHRRDRIDGEQSLIDQLELALTYSVQYQRGSDIPDLMFGVLDLPMARQRTMQGSSVGPSVSIFDLMEDGRAGFDHGSPWYGFLPLEQALGLADACSAQLGLSEELHQSLRKHIEDHMAGKHGDGIMVRLNEPLFFAYPEFGLALEHGIKPHAGFTAWNVFHRINESVGRYAIAAMDHAVVAAGNRIRQGDAGRSPMR